MIYIGIDPGSVKTGIAIWLTEQKGLHLKQFNSHSESILFVYNMKNHSDNEGINISKEWKVVIEDARLYIPSRKLAAISGDQRKQGAGYVKALSKDWEEFCKLLSIPYVLVPPTHTVYKNSPELFEQLTGIKTLKGESHKRDAALLVYGK